MTNERSRLLYLNHPPAISSNRPFVGLSARSIASIVAVAIAIVVVVVKVDNISDGQVNELQIKWPNK